MAYTPIRFTSGNPVGTNNATTTLYTVPASNNLIVTNLTVVSANGDANGLNLYLGDNQSTNGYGGTVSYNRDLPHGAERYHQGFYVVNAGGQINALVISGAPNAYFSGNGLVGTGKFEGGDPTRVSYTATTTGDITAYTVPAGRTFVIKSMVITNITSVSQKTAIRLAGVPVTPWINGGDFVAIPSHQTRQYDGTWILNAAETVIVNMSTAATPGVNFYLSGVLY